MAADSHYEILHPDDLQALTAEGSIIASEDPGTLRMHKSRLYHSSDEEYKNITLPSPIAGSTNEDFVKIPAFLISRETLIYIGFTDTAAKTIWVHWNNINNNSREIDGGPVTFESTFRARVHNRGEDTYSADDDEWRALMDVLGLAQDFQGSMLTPCCKGIRLTESCKFWILDTLSACYDDLKEIQTTSRERAMAARRVASPS